MGRISIGSVVAAAALIAGVVPATAAASTYSNPNSITIPEEGTATPYPSTILVDGVPGRVTRVRATLHAVSHTFPEDIEALLVAPNGQRTVLMSFVCGDGDPGEEATGQTFSFEDGAPSLTFFAFCPSGTYRPSLNPAFDPPLFPPPAPAGPQTTVAMSALIGSPANGTWRLFVFDPADPDGGSIAGGWTLDLLTNAACSGRLATLTGTAGPDVLIGTPGPDVILGFGGNDKIKSQGGKDIVCGGDGADIIKGANGADRLFGERGVDRIFGGAGKDAIRGGKGPDKLFGRGNRDNIKGNRGADKLGGGGGNDVLAGNKGKDKLFGGGGNDLLKGGKGFDRCSGDRGGKDKARACNRVKTVP